MAFEVKDLKDMKQNCGWIHLPTGGKKAAYSGGWSLRGVEVPGYWGARKKEPLIRACLVGHAKFVG